MHNKNINNEKANDLKGALKKLFKSIKPYLVPLIIAIILSIISAIFSIISPDKISDITDEITKGIISDINLDKIKSITLFLGVIYSLSTIFGYVQGFIMSTITNKYSRDLREKIDLKINKLPLRYFDSNSYGDLLSRVTNDVDTIGTTLNNSIGNLCSAITLFVGVVFMMFVTNWIMAITAITATLIGFILMGVIMGKSQKYFILQQKELGKINGHIEETYSGHTVVKVYNGIEESDKKFDKINEALYHSAKMSQFLSGLMGPLMNFIGNFGYVAVCVVGASLVISGNITIGVIVSFMIYTRLFTSPLSTIAQAFTQLQSTAAASERVFNFLDENELSLEKKNLQYLDKNKAKGYIEFKNVKFSYNDKDMIIKGFSASVKPGQKIAIVGPTGAGKTTIINLLMRFYEINSGSIKIDDIDIKDISRENIHDLFCMVLQDTWLFEGTIKENIIFNQKNISDEDIKKACKTVGLHHFIKSLEDGYDTVLGDTETLSGGQKQLLTIARGMIKKSPFLILDEATSNVDTRTEVLVQNAMDKLTEGKTSFIIAHRLSTIKNADLILVMKDGNIIEQGNHKELIKKEGFYADLYNSQFKKEQ